MQLTKARSSELYKSWKTKQKKHKVKGNCLKGIPRKKQNAPKKKSNNQKLLFIRDPTHLG